MAKTKWQQLMNPDPPPRIFASYTVAVPLAYNRDELSTYVINGYEGEVEQEVERMVAAFRAVGEEPTVTRKVNWPVDM